MIKCNFFEPFLVLLNDGNKSIVPHGELSEDRLDKLQLR